ncbi:MAG: hypothetical protein JWP87_3029 [Labilithrix sp.]|nr:hypothetical protein [Labilithrix sp.]
MRRSLAVAILLASALACPAIAHAAPEPSAGDLATARNALKEGLALREQGDLLGALGRFTTAYDLVQTPVTAFELAKTHLLMGHVLQAHELFIKIGRLPPALEESQRSATAREEANRLAADLEPRIPTLRLHLRLPPDATAAVRIDEDPIVTTGAVTPRAVDPGKHVIIAHAGDGPELRVTVDVAEGETKDVDLAPQWVPPKAPVTPPGGGQVVYLRQTNPLVFVGFTVSSVALTLTGVAAVLAVNAAGRAHDRCGSDYCPQHVRDSDVTEMGTWLVVTGVAGGATLAFFTLAVLSIGKPVNEKVTAHAGARPYIGPGSAGVVGSF